jgi:hypothetical protein
MARPLPARSALAADAELLSILRTGVAYWRDKSLSPEDRRRCAVLLMGHLSRWLGRFPEIRAEMLHLPLGEIATAIGDLEDGTAAPWLKPAGKRGGRSKPRQERILTEWAASAARWLHKHCGMSEEGAAEAVARCLAGADIKRRAGGREHDASDTVDGLTVQNWLLKGGAPVPCPAYVSELAPRDAARRILADLTDLALRRPKKK